MIRTLCLVGAAIAVLSSGCESKSSGPTYEAADQFVLYSIDGTQGPGVSVPADAPVFHGHPVLGETAIDDPKKRAELMDALYDGIEGNDDTVADCWMPRHGIRVVEGEQTTDYVICFECLVVAIYRGQERSSELTTDSPRAVFNRYLKEAGLPLAP